MEEGNHSCVSCSGLLGERYSVHKTTRAQTLSGRQTTSLKLYNPPLGPRLRQELINEPHTALGCLSSSMGQKHVPVL